MSSELFWALSRLAALGGWIFIVLAVPSGELHGGWRVGLLGGCLAAVGLQFYLRAYRRRPETDYSDPYSVTKPFYPFNRYPVRSWLAQGFCPTAAGLIGLAIGRMAPNFDSTMPGIALALGAPILASTLIYSRFR